MGVVRKKRSGTPQTTGRCGQAKSRRRTSSTRRALTPPRPRPGGGWRRRPSGSRRRSSPQSRSALAPLARLPPPPRGRARHAPRPRRSALARLGEGSPPGLLVKLRQLPADRHQRSPPQRDGEVASVAPILLGRLVDTLGCSASAISLEASGTLGPSPRQEAFEPPACRPEPCHHQGAHGRRGSRHGRDLVSGRDGRRDRQLARVRHRRCAGVAHDARPWRPPRAGRAPPRRRSASLCACTESKREARSPRRASS